MSAWNLVSGYHKFEKPDDKKHDAHEDKGVAQNELQCP